MNRQRPAAPVTLILALYSALTTILLFTRSHEVAALRVSNAPEQPSAEGSLGSETNEAASSPPSQRLGTTLPSTSASGGESELPAVDLIQSWDSPALPAFCRSDYASILMTVDDRLQLMAVHHKLSPSILTRLRPILIAKEGYERSSRNDEDERQLAAIEKERIEVLGTTTVAKLDEGEMERQSHAGDLALIREAEITAALVADKLSLTEAQHTQLISELSQAQKQPGLREMSFYARKLNLSPEQRSRVGNFLSGFALSEISPAVLEDFANKIAAPRRADQSIDWDQVSQLYVLEHVRSVLSPEQFRDYLALQKELAADPMYSALMPPP